MNLANRWWQISCQLQVTLSELHVFELWTVIFPISCWEATWHAMGAMGAMEDWLRCAPDLDHNVFAGHAG